MLIVIGILVAALVATGIAAQMGWSNSAKWKADSKAKDIHNKALANSLIEANNAGIMSNKIKSMSRADRKKYAIESGVIVDE